METKLAIALLILSQVGGYAGEAGQYQAPPEVQQQQPPQIYVPDPASEPQMVRDVDPAIIQQIFDYSQQQNGAPSR